MFIQKCLDRFGIEEKGPSPLTRSGLNGQARFSTLAPLQLARLGVVALLPPGTEPGAPARYYPAGSHDVDRPKSPGLTAIRAASRCKPNRTNVENERR